MSDVGLRMMGKDPEGDARGVEVTDQGAVKTQVTGSDVDLNIASVKKVESIPLIGSYQEPHQENYKGILSVMGLPLYWTYKGHSTDVTSVTTDNNRNVYSGSQTIRKTDENGNDLWSRFDGSFIWGIVATDDYVYHTSNNRVRKLNAKDGETVWDENIHSGMVWRLVLSSDGYLYSCSSDNTVKKLNPDNGDVIWTFEGHSQTVESLTADESGNVFSGSLDGSVKKIDSDGNEVWSNSGHSSGVTSLFYYDGFVFAGARGGNVRKINASDGETVWDYTGHDGSVWGLYVDVDGNIYTGSSDHSLQKIDQEGNKQWVLRNRHNSIRDLTVSKDGFIYTGDRDNEVKKFYTDMQIKGYRVVGV